MHSFFLNQDYAEEDELKVSHFILFIFFSVILVQKRIAFTEMRNLLYTQENQNILDGFENKIKNSFSDNYNLFKVLYYLTSEIFQD